MITIALENCNAAVQDLIKQIETQDMIILTENDEPRYILGSIDDDNGEALALSNNQEFLDYLDQARERARLEGTISLAEVRHRLKIPHSFSG